MNILLNINKPKGVTSYDVIREIKKKISEIQASEANTVSQGKTKVFPSKQKIGHFGTLDPMAAGVLLVAIGKATKLGVSFLEKEKEYIGVLQLGVITDTWDITGKIIEEKKIKVKEKAIKKVFSQFKGEIFQTPPFFSALKHKGKPLYKFARKGIEIKKEPRKVFIKEIEILKIDLQEITFRVLCSKGTYVRSLCYDIGKELGCGCCLKELTRTAIGEYQIKKSVLLEEIKKLNWQEIEKFNLL